VRWLRTLPAAGDPPALALAPVYRVFGWRNIAYGVARWSPAILAVLFLMPFAARWGRPASGDASLRPVTHAAGAEIVTPDGRPAGRARLLARSAVLALPVAAVAGAYYSGAHTLLLDVATGAALVSVAALGWAVWRPDRGPVERASGTVLVPGDVTVDLRAGLQWTARPLRWPALRAAVGQPLWPMTWAQVEPLARAHLAKATNGPPVSMALFLPFLVIAGFTLYLLEGRPDDRVSRIDEQRNLEAAVQRGQPDARAEMARRLLAGQGTARDPARAAELLAGLANEGDNEAARQLAMMYARGAPLAQDGARAVELLQTAASRGDGRAATTLGRLYEQGTGLPASAQQAAAWYGQAAAAGDPEGMVELARCLRRGIGTRHDPQLAFRWLVEAATRHRSVRAGAEVAQAYARGIGTEKDTGKALAWYEWAADRGSPVARRGLAVLYLTGP
jgi:TPR repeat protein